MPFSLTGRTRLAVLALDLAVMIGGVVGLSTIGPSSSDGVVAGADRGQSRDLTSTTAGRTDRGGEVMTFDTTPTTAASGTGTVKQPGQSTATTAGSNATPPPALDGLTPTREGVYETRVTSEGFGSAPGEEDEVPDVETETVEVRTLRRTVTDVRQMFTTRSEGDAADEGEEQEYHWTQDALLVVAPAADEDADCSSDELRFLKLPLAAGSSWSDRMECTYQDDSDEGEPETMRVRVDFTSKVTGSRQVQVAGRSLFVWEIEMEVRSRAGQDRESVMTRRVQFSPELGFEVRAVEEHQLNSEPGNEFRFRQTTELLKFPTP